MAVGNIPESIIHLDPVISSGTTNREAQQFIQGLSSLRDVGYVTRDTYIPMYLWNGSLSGATITGITADEEAEGVEWDLVTPRPVLPKTSVRVVLTVTSEGPLEFLGLLTFLATSGNIGLSLLGTRAPQLAGDIAYWLHGHNWENGFEESFSWKTDIMTSYNFTEQRVKIRQNPRRMWNLKYIMQGDYRRKFESELRMRKVRYSIIPHPNDIIQLSTPILAGDTTIYIDPDFTDYGIGRYLMVWENEHSYEIKSISSVGADFLIVDAPFERDWGIGSYASSCRMTNPVDSRQVSRATDDVAVYDIQFMLTDEVSLSIFEVDTYKGIPLCPFAINFDSITETFTNNWIKLDNDIGVIEYEITNIEPIVYREIPFMINGREEVDTFKRFLYYCSGKLQPFWIQSSEEAFRVVSDITSGDTFILIENINYSAYSFGGYARANIEIITTSGIVVRATIVDVEVLPSFEEKLILSASIDYDIPITSILKCSWLEKVRLDSDNISIKWEMGNTLISKLPIRTIP